MSRWFRKSDHPRHRNRTRIQGMDFGVNLPPVYVMITWNDGKVEYGKEYTKDQWEMIRVHNRNWKSLLSQVELAATVEVYDLWPKEVAHAAQEG